MSAKLKFHIFRSFQASLVLDTTRGLLRAAFRHDLPERAHVFFGHELVCRATEHQDRCRSGDERYFGGRVPLLVA